MTRSIPWTRKRVASHWWYSLKWRGIGFNSIKSSSFLEIIPNTCSHTLLRNSRVVSPMYIRPQGQMAKYITPTVLQVMVWVIWNFLVLSEFQKSLAASICAHATQCPHVRHPHLGPFEPNEHSERMPGWCDLTNMSGFQVRRSPESDNRIPWDIFV